MAELVLSDIAVGLISKLGSSVLKEIGLRWDLEDELDKLKRTVSTVEAVLLHAEEQSLENPQVKNWLGMLSEALYDADDLLDEFSTEALRQHVMGGSKFGKKVRVFFSSSNQLAFGLKMGHKVKAVRERLDEIANVRSFRSEERSYVGRVHRAKGRDQTLCYPPQVVIGRDLEKKAIVELLLSSDYKENVSVVPIVGIGGLGKTTLAQLVYNDDMVKNHFELRMWVCVSDDFDVRLLVQKVLESATGQPPQHSLMDPLKDLLHEKINGIRYLLVLDDVWNEDVNKWLSFRDLFAGGARGSKIVITTRLRKVAETSRPISIHELRGLSENESWSLFKQVAFKQGQVLNPRHKAMGREIVAKCHGVPLVIKTMGIILYYKDVDSEWLLLKNEEFSKIDVCKNDIFPILKLSYNYLPSHCKHCFAYCSLYPKGYSIRVEELIQLWRAQGYLKSTGPNECFRDVGFGYFMELFQLSFFQDVKRDELGNIQYFTMHELIHDLAISVSGDNFSKSHSEMIRVEDKTRSMSFQVHPNYISQDFSSLLKAKKIRTILPFNQYGMVHIKEEELDAIFCNLRRLRVLSLSHMPSDTLPSSICKLKHLRYLDISYNEIIKKLPDSITNLQNLQVLKLSWCKKLMQLPNNITKLVNLTDLDNDGCFGLTHMPRGIGQLTQLEKLSTFVIAKDHSISKHSGGLDVLHGLNNLRGALTITNLSYVKNVAFEFKEADLSAKEKLQKLTLDWNRYEGDNSNYSSNDVANDEMVLEALCPHQSLKGLSVLYYRGMSPPSWLPSITNLVSIRFGNCRNIQWLPSFDHLPYLKSLRIDELTALERIDVESGGSSSFFPSLTYLNLSGCPNLKGFVRCNTSVGTELSSLSTEELPCFPCLSEMEIDGCPNLISVPLFPELKTLTLRKDGIKSLMVILKMTLDWSGYEDENNNCSANDVANDEMGLEALRPLQSLKGLSVYSYGGVRPPSWLPSLTNLVSICFGNCRNIQWLPPFDQLPYLKNFWVSNLTDLECIDIAANFENGRSLLFFPSLIDLSLTGCPNLKGFVRCKTGDGKKPMEELPCFPCVSTLQIGGCPNLTYMPLFPEIKILKLEQDGIKSLMEILKMTTSESQSTSLYFLSLSQLERLSIMKVEDFPEDPLPQYLPSLQHLEFRFCSFKTLCSDEEDCGMQWQCLQVINSIEFNSIRNLVSLPKGLQYVTTLQRLGIHGCDSLIFIPEWICNLIELEHLIINDCPQLSERCKNNTAEDWPKISHIPNISIDNRSIQRNGYYLL